MVNMPASFPPPLPGFKNGLGILTPGFAALHPGLDAFAPFRGYCAARHSRACMARIVGQPQFARMHREVAAGGFRRTGLKKTVTVPNGKWHRMAWVHRPVGVIVIPVYENVRANAFRSNSFIQNTTS